MSLLMLQGEQWRGLASIMPSSENQWLLRRPLALDQMVCIPKSIYPILVMNDSIIIMQQ